MWVWEDVEVVAGKPTLDASLPGALGVFFLGDEMNEASLVGTRAYLVLSLVLGTWQAVGFCVEDN